MKDIWTPERRNAALAACAMWRGTPYARRASVAGRGVDCLHALRVILVAAGVIDKRPLGRYLPNDGIWSEVDTLKAAMQECLHVEDATQLEPLFGDICGHKTGGRSAHVSFFAGSDLWHSMAGGCFTRTPWVLERGRVAWRLRLVGIGWKSTPRTSWVVKPAA